MTKSRALGEDWINLDMDNENKLKINRIQLEESISTLLALILSLFLAVIIGEFYNLFT